MRPLTTLLLVLFTIVISGAQVAKVEIITSFEPPDGFTPHGNLVEGPDGHFYGTTMNGGPGYAGAGTVFRFAAEGTLSTIFWFGSPIGISPTPLTLGVDGRLYGALINGENGRVFALTTNGNVDSWQIYPEDKEGWPIGALAAGQDGLLYGLASGGCLYGCSSAFRVSMDGDVTRLASLNEETGFAPRAGLTLGTDGHFYGTTYIGGAGSGLGTVFRLSTNGTLTRLVTFIGANGARPSASLVRDADNRFYGTASGGGQHGKGTVFRMQADGVLQTLIAFDGTNGSSPQASLTLAPDGSLYGTTSAGGSHDLGTVFRITADGALTTLISFGGTNGAKPLGGLTLGSDGSFYGTTSEGGIAGWGTVFRIAPNGELIAAASFTGRKGRRPMGEMALGHDGFLYGTAFEGGVLDKGAVFRADGTNYHVASFMQTNGRSPADGLILGQDGSFYGTAQGGGTSNMGCVFRVTPAGTLTSLVSFTGRDGAYPMCRLTPQARDGSFFGSTYGGGAHGLGTLFRVATNGSLWTLWSFAGTNGSRPIAGLTLGANGVLYGTCSEGGLGGMGTVFEFSPGSDLRVLATFFGTNGAKPSSGLTLASDGSLYGTTTRDGTRYGGNVFRITTNGVISVLYNLNHTGMDIQKGLILGSDGALYGTTYGEDAAFRITTNGTFTRLAPLRPNQLAGVYYGELSIGRDQSLYGTSDLGGAHGLGAVYRLGVPPGITSQPESAPSSLLPSASFSVVPSGTPLNYQWFTSSGRTATAVPVMLRPGPWEPVVDAIVTDGGQGYDTPPKFRLSGASIDSGTGVVSEGSVTGLKVTDFRPWRSPPTIVIANPPSTLTPLHGQTNSTLLLADVIGLHPTNYCVVVANTDGSVTSSMVSVTMSMPPRSLTASKAPNGLKIELVGQPGRSYILEATTNLVQPIAWSPIHTNVPGALGAWRFADTNLSGVAQRFYRAAGE